MELTLRPHLFWDVDFEKLDPDKSKRLIIERVLSLGRLNEFYQVLSYYGEDTIKKIIVNTGYLDEKTFEFAHSYFDIPKDQFQCYIKKQSGLTHWP